MGEWLLFRRDRLIVAGHEVPAVGHLEKVTRGDLCPEGGYRAKPRVSTLGTSKINEFALKLKGRPDKTRTYCCAKITVRN